MVKRYAVTLTAVTSPRVEMTADRQMIVEAVLNALNNQHVYVESISIEEIKESTPGTPAGGRQEKGGA